MTYVLFVALLNLSLGMVAAVLLKRRLESPPAPEVKRRRRPKAKRLKGDLVSLNVKPVSASATSTAEPAEPVEKPPAAPITLPQEWQATLGDMPFTDLLEPAGWLLHKTAIELLTKVGKEASTVRDLAGAQAGDGQFTKISKLVTDCGELLRARTTQIDEALQAAGFQFGPLTSIAVRLESYLQQVRDELDNVDQGLANSSHSDERRAEHLADAYHGTARLLHDLRDQAEAIAVAVLAATGRIGDPATDSFRDANWSLPNRLDLERALQEWNEQNPGHERLASFVLYDVDQVRTFNEDLGLDKAEKILAAVGRIYHDGIRHNRGFDRIFRIGGQQYLLFLGDTSPQNAAFASERIRQTLLQMTIRCENKTFQVSSAAVVAALQKTDTSETLLERLSLAIRRVKKTDVRSTVITHDGKVSPAEAKAYQLPGQVIEV